MVNQLLVTLDGIRDDGAGVPVEELSGINGVPASVLSALSAIVTHLSGHQEEHRQSDSWVRKPQGLSLRRSDPGYLFAQWTLEPSLDHQTNPESYENQAIDMLLESSSSDDPVSDYLREISDALPQGVLLWLGDSDSPNRIGIKNTEGTIDELGLGDDETLVSDLHAIGLRCAALLGPGPSAADHGDLLYDERGLPK